MTSRSARRMAACVCGCLTLPTAARAVTFSTIADYSTTIPGTTQTFGGFSVQSVNYDGTTVSFLGAGSSVGGAYASTAGTLSTLVDTSTTDPSTGTPFAAFGGLDDQGGNFVVEAGISSTNLGIYTNVGGGLSTVADTNTTVPGTSVKFTGFGALPQISSTGTLTFIGASSSTSPSSGGAYSNQGGGIHVVADTHTTMPGGTTTFSSFTITNADGNTVAYGGTDSSNSYTGIYTEQNGGSATVIANQSTSIPGGTGTFGFFGRPVVSGQNVAFTGGRAGTLYGTYADIDGSLIRIEDQTTAAPGGGTFGSPTGMSFSGDDVVFESKRSTASGVGLYLYDNGNISTIIEAGETLDGRTISSLGLIGDDAFYGSSVAFEAGFTDNTSGIFLATVPEPTSMMLATGLGGLTLLRGRRRR